MKEKLHNMFSRFGKIIHLAWKAFLEITFMIMLLMIFLQSCGITHIFDEPTSDPYANYGNTEQNYERY